MGESLPHFPLAGAEPRDGACGAESVPGGRGRWPALVSPGDSPGDWGGAGMPGGSLIPAGNDPAGGNGPLAGAEGVAG